MKKSILFVIIVSILFCTQSLAYDWSTNPGEGSEDNPFQVSTPEQLNSIGSDTSLWNKCFKVTADIDLSQLGEEPFNVIGNISTPFKGLFDGDQHIISNLSLDLPDYSNVGLFGQVGPGGVVKNLGLENVDITGGNQVGGLAGMLNGASVSHCYVTGKVSGKSQVGGLVAYNTGVIKNSYSISDVTGNYLHAAGLVGRNIGTIENSYANGNVKGKDFVGGISGYNSGRILRSFAKCSIVGSRYVGGLTGRNQREIQHCYAICDILAGRYLGGLVGDQVGGTISYCYSSGPVKGDKYVGGLIGASTPIIGSKTYLSFWDYESSGLLTSCGGFAKTSEQMKLAENYVGWGKEGIWKIDSGNDFPFLAWEDKAGELISDSSGQYSGGNGTYESPFQLATAEDLCNLSAFTEDWDRSFILIDDIIIDPNEDNCFHVIGSTHPFTGMFDGNGHVISNLEVNFPHDRNVGIFGETEGAVIKNLYLENVSVTGLKCTGLLVGNMENSLIDNCHAADVNIDGYITGGGLVGQCTTSVIGNSELNGNVRGSGGVVAVADSTAFHNCHFSGVIEGPIMGYRGIGGLIGFCEDCSIIQSSTDAEIDNNDLVMGGLIGYCKYSSVFESFSKGSLEGYKNYIGGLIGSSENSDVLNCYTECTIRSQKVGGLIYGGFVGGKIENCYCVSKHPYYQDHFYSLTYSTDIDTCYYRGIGDSDGSLLNEIDMKKSSSFVGWDFFFEIENGTDDIWFIREGEHYPKLWWEHHRPVAITGQDQSFYDRLEGFVEVKLDGNASYDVDGDDLSYYWYNDASELIATGAAPDIILSVGEHVLTLIVNDGVEDSEPNTVNVTVIEALQTTAEVLPRTINTESRGRYVVAKMLLPDGVSKDDIAADSLTLNIGDVTIESIMQRKITSDNGNFVFAAFVRRDLAALAAGKSKLDIVIEANLKTGRYIYGKDSIKIVSPKAPEKNLRGRREMRPARKTRTR